MSEELKKEEQVTATHMAIKLETLETLYAFLKSRADVSYEIGSTVMEIIQRDNVSITLKDPDDIVAPPGPGHGDEEKK